MNLKIISSIFLLSTILGCRSMMLVHGMGGNADPPKMTPLMNAALSGNAQTTLSLIKAGAPVNERAGYGWTALHWAVRTTSKIEVVKILLESGADPNIRGNDLPWTPLEIAIDNHNENIVKILVRFGGNVLQTDPSGKSLLYRLSNSYIPREKRPSLDSVVAEIGSFLISKGTSLDQAARDGRTALMVASSKGHRELVKVLVSAGANASLIDYKGNSALFYAKVYQKDLLTQLAEAKKMNPNNTSYNISNDLALELKSQNDLIEFLEVLNKDKK